MTSFPAQRLGLPDRGLLVEGFKADIVVFDPKTVKAPATKRNPKQYPIGHRLRDSQRPGGDRRRREHGGAAGAGPSPGAGG